MLARNANAYTGVQKLRRFYWLSGLRNYAIRMPRACLSILLAAVKFPLLLLIVLLPKHRTAHYIEIFVLDWEDEKTKLDPPPSPIGL